MIQCCTALAAVVVGSDRCMFWQRSESGVKRDRSVRLYSQEEISAAMDTAQEYFDDHFPMCDDSFPAR